MELAASIFGNDRPVVWTNVQRPNIIVHQYGPFDDPLQPGMEQAHRSLVDAVRTPMTDAELRISRRSSDLVSTINQSAAYITWVGG